MPQGRPLKADWDALYKEWLTSGMTKRAFLKSKNLSPNAPQSRMWKAEIWQAREKIAEAIRSRQADEPDQLADLMSSVKMWALGLAPKHYKASQMLRLHAEIYMEKQFLHDDTGAIVGTHLKPQQLSQLSTVLSTCQKMDRLACGLSTENVFIPNQGDGAEKGKHVEDDKKQLEDNRRSGPVFVVEVSRNGKFMRPRPRLMLNQTVIDVDSESA